MPPTQGLQDQLLLGKHCDLQVIFDQEEFHHLKNKDMLLENGENFMAD